MPETGRTPEPPEGKYRPWDIRMAWAPFSGPGAISGSNGIFEIADGAGRMLYIGSAGARDLFGLRGRITEHFQAGGPAAWYRYEVTSAYLSRHMELLGRYQETHHTLPPGNQAESSTYATLPRFGDRQPESG